MKNRPRGRFLSLFVVFTLALPQSALALREIQAVDSDLEEKELAERLLGPSRSHQVVPLSTASQLTAGMEERQEYPLPLSMAEHPWNRRNPGKGYSFLGRYYSQNTYLRETLLPALGARKLAIGDRTLTFFFSGEATAENEATVASIILEAFESHPGWGPIEGWSVSFFGVDLDEEGVVISEARRRIQGYSPFIFKGDHLSLAKHRQEVDGIMRTLNAHGALVRNWMRVEKADLADLMKTELSGVSDVGTEAQKMLRMADVVYFNAIWGAVESKGRKEGVRFLREKSKEAYVIYASPYPEGEGEGEALEEIAPARTVSLPHDHRRSDGGPPSYVIVPLWAKGAAGLEERMPTWLQPALGADWVEVVYGVHEMAKVTDKVAVLLQPELLGVAEGDSDTEIALMSMEGNLHGAFGWSEQTKLRLGLLTPQSVAAFEDQGYRVIRVVRHPESEETPLPWKAIPLVVAEALAGGPLIFWVNVTPYLNLKGITLPEILATLTDLFA